MNEDFSTFHLLQDEKRFLNRVRRKGKLSYSERDCNVVSRLDSVNLLYHHGHIAPDGFGSHGFERDRVCELSTVGKRYFSYCHDKRMDFLKHFFSQFLSGVAVGVALSLISGFLAGLFQPLI